MPVTITPVDIGSAPGDGTGDGARTAFGQLNTNEAAIKAAIEKSEVKDYVVALGDEVTDMVVGDAAAVFRPSFALTLTGIFASVTTAPTGSTLIFDVTEGGVSILSTLLTIDATEKTSVTAAVAAVISDAAIAADSELQFNIDQIGATIAGTGGKITLLGYKT